ncbi:hypothetical protein A3850_013705 [Lewinella sp. 4G2]|nr:hypothetical protein A3850_013705 [Lewinella sp. 4G2]
MKRPNLLSLIILGGIVIVASTYGFLTYTQSPDLEHYAVDPNYGFGYNFDRPDDVAKLPNDLAEISGLSPWFEDGKLLAVQDEDGELFIIDAKSGKVERSFKFDKDKDYEGVARKGDTIYVLEQDGDLHRLIYADSIEEYQAEKIETAFSYRNDTEGIAYDSLTDALLIVPKEEELNPGEDDYRHGIYSFSLVTNQIIAQPTYYIDEFEVGEAVYGKRSRYNFKPSGVAVDPITNDIYVIGSVGKILVVIDRESNIKHIELLKENIFRQPEGVEFSRNGDLYISSEAKGKKAVIARFSRKEKAGDKTNSNE